MLNPSHFHRDPKAKSLSFYATEPTVEVNRDLLQALISESEAHGNVNARICLHPSPESNFHEMIILEREGYYYPPHRHLEKAQSCHIMRGECVVFVFSHDGKITHADILGRNGNMFIRIGENRHHMILPLTEYCIYHEGKPGPFIPEGDSIFAEWAPKREDTEGVAAYLADLRKHAGV